MQPQINILGNEHQQLQATHTKKKKGQTLQASDESIQHLQFAKGIKLNLIKPLDITAKVQEVYKREEHAQLYQKYGISKFQTWKISESWEYHFPWVMGFQRITCKGNEVIENLLIKRSQL